jgi:calcium channel MID1
MSITVQQKVRGGDWRGRHFEIWQRRAAPPPRVPLPPSDGPAVSLPHVASGMQYGARAMTAALVLLLALVPWTDAAATTLTLPSLTTFNQSSSTSTFFFVPTQSSAAPLWITLSLCSPPTSLLASLPNHLAPTLYLSTSPTDTTPGPASIALAGSTVVQSTPLYQGFGNLSAVLSNGNEGVWIGVWSADEVQLGGSGGGMWNWELGVSSGGMGGVRVLDGGASYRFEDSDRTNALLTTANYTDVGGTGPIPRYTAIVTRTTHLTTALAASYCAVAAIPRILQTNIVSSVTTRGYGSGNAVQYEVGALTGGVNYTAWLVEAVGGGTRLWNPVWFTTKMGRSSSSSVANCKLTSLLTGDNCRLVHSLPFCPNVAYSVPSPPTLPTPLLVDFYNSSLQPSLAMFARTLTTFPCNDLSMGAYSRISTCDDCTAAYLDWACAVTMPRCTDAPSTAALNDSASLEWMIPATYQQTLLRSSPNTSRTPLLAPLSLASTFNTSVPLSTPFPYAEVPPCLETCYSVKAKCPSLVQWGCPTDGGTGMAGYGMGQMLGVEARMAGDPGGEGVRGSDRWGNVL